MGGPKRGSGALVAIATLAIGCLTGNPDWGAEQDSEAASSDPTTTTATEGTSGGPTTIGTSSTAGTSESTTTVGTSTTVDPPTATDGGSSGTGEVVVTYADEVIQDAPIHYWRLGETSGVQAVDMKGNTPGTYLGDVQLGQPGLIAGSDTSVYFPGNGPDVLRVADIAGFAGRALFSVEAWILPDSDNAGCFIGKSIYGTEYDGWFLASFQSVIRFDRLQMGNMNAAQPVGPDPIHIVATYDGFTGALYIDGVRATSRVHEVDVLDHGDPLLIGDCANWGNFSGFIDEVAIYDYVLSDDQIARHHALGRGEG